MAANKIHYRDSKSFDTKKLAVFMKEMYTQGYILSI
jgi:hypothetical protein